ncbi:hypothetical protein SK128_017170, partial [Halocaridina rubra]
MEESDLLLQWKLEEGRLEELGQALSRAMSEAFEHPSFCGTKDMDFTIKEAFLYIVGYNDYQFMGKDILNQLDE